MTQELLGCELGWIECGSGTDAHTLEKKLLAAWFPPLTLV